VWAQLIKARVKPGTDLSAMTDVLMAAEQPDSGLVREMFMHDQNDPGSVYVLAMFESEEKARERERDPRRAAGQQDIQAFLADALAGPPEFIDLTVTTDWVPPQA
jgi:hypothetical protein